MFYGVFVVKFVVRILGTAQAQYSYIKLNCMHDWGSRGRMFKSCHSDHKKHWKHYVFSASLFFKNCPKLNKN